MKNFKLSIKVTLLLCALIIPIVLLGMGFVYFKVSQVIRASETNQYLEMVRVNAAELAADIRSTAQSSADLKSVLEEIRNNGQADRVLIPALFRSSMQAYPSFQAIWACFEPNAWDGLDTKYIGKENYDENTGRFSPWVYRSDGTVVTELQDWGEEAYTEDYYTIPKSINRLTILEPYVDDDGQDTFMTSVVAPLSDRTGTFFGVIGIDIALKDIESKVQSMKVGKAGWACLISAEGNILAHTNPEIEKNNFSEIENPEIISLAKDVKDQQIQSGFIRSKEIGDAFVVAAPIACSPNDTWTFIVAVPIREIDAVATSILYWVLAITAILTVLLVISGGIVGTRIANPVKIVATSLARIAVGDFTVRVQSKSNDELGSLSTSFNTLSESLSLSFSSLRTAVNDISRESIELSKASDASALAVSAIADRVAEGSSASEEQEQVIENSSAAIYQILSSVDALDSLIEKQTTTLNQTYGKVEEFVADVAETASSLDEFSNQFNELSSSSERSLEQVESLHARVEEVSRKTDALEEANQAVATIAEGTNTLAMNAAIEAAHAGDAGKGFAVVADEIGKLAASASERSQEIDAILASVRIAVEAMHAESKATINSFNDVQKNLKKAAAVESNLRNTTVRQNQESDRVVENLKTVESLAMRVQNDAREMRKSGSTVSMAIESLKKSGLRLKSVMQKVEDETSNIRDASASVGTAVDANQVAVDIARASLNRFTI